MNLGLIYYKFGFRGQKFIKMSVLIIICSLFLSKYTNLPLISQHDDSDDSPQIHIVNELPNQDTIEPSASLLSYTSNNVSLFNVSESIFSIAPQTSLDIDSENLTLEIPSGWDFENARMNISDLYKSWEVIQNQNITGSGEFWDFDTNIPFVDPNTLYFIGDSTTGNLKLNGRSNKYSSYFDGDYASWSQTVTNPENDLQIYESELIRENSNQTLLQNDFSVNPFWQPLLNFPYGGTNGTSIYEAEYDPSSEYLSTYIKAGSNELSLGNPSVGWQTNFTNPNSLSFKANRFELTVSWNLESIDLEAEDNLSIIIRIDDQYVDGRIDVDGNTYLDNATEITIENSVVSGVLDHDTITRTFDITEMIDSSKEFHTIDFGIWLENIDETNDEVRVNFAALEIKAIEEDQYKTGELSFTCEIDMDKYINFVDDWQLFYSFSNSTSVDFHRIGYVSDYFSSLIGTQRINVNLSSHSRSFLNQQEYRFSLGLVGANNNTTLEKDTLFVYFDDISLCPIYRSTNFSKAQLQIFNGTGYEQVVESSFDFLESVHNNYINASFLINNPDYANSQLNFISSLSVNNFQENLAQADFFIDVNDLTNGNEIKWNVSYNNSDTFTHFSLNNYENFKISYYNFTIIDLPALDSLGKDSIDWDFRDYYDPSNTTPNYATAVHTNGTLSSGTHQNVTIVNATKLEDFYINGTWILKFLSQNYIEDLKLKSSTGSIILPKVYFGNETKIKINQIFPSDLTGNYRTEIRNASDIIISSFPKFNSSIVGNLSLDWSVPNLLPGEYKIVAYWNDSTTENQQFSRVGFLTYDFEIWGQTKANLLRSPDVLSPSDKGTFYFNFTNYFGNTLSGIEPYVTLYCLNTSNNWGLEWSPYQYLVTGVIENQTDGSYGNYSLEFQTRYVPDGAYNVSIIIEKPFYDSQSLLSLINITGSEMLIDVISGGFNLNATHALLDSNNIPYLNDTSHTSIVLYLYDTWNYPLENGLISGTYNGSDRSFYAIDLYKNSQNDQDLGKYELTFDTTGLNATNPAIGNYNYSLTLSISAEGYSSINLEISSNILPIPTELALSTINSVYEGELLELFATYSNILNPSSPILLNNAILTWILQNSTHSNLMSGFFENVFSGMYEIEQNLSPTLQPGTYELIINGSQENCAFASKTISNFKILSKNKTYLNIGGYEGLQIGTTMTITAVLGIINGTVLPSQEVTFNLKNGEDYLINIIEYTNEFGIASVSQPLYPYYADLNLTLEAVYEGGPTMRGISDSIENIHIKGKNEVNLTISSISPIRVGYSPIISLSLSIENVEDYSEYFITLSGWYENNSQTYIVNQQLLVNSHGLTSYEIPQIDAGYDNLTFFVYFTETEIISYASKFETFGIIAKWETNLTISHYPEQIRPGYYFEYDIEAKFLDQSCPESFFQLPVEINYYYSQTHITQILYFDENGNISVQILVLDEFQGGFNISLSFSGSEKIDLAEFQFNYSRVLPKWQLEFEFEIVSDYFQIGYEAEILISAAFENASCTENIYGKSIFVQISYHNHSDLQEIYFNLQNQTYLNFLIPQVEKNTLNLSVSFLGTSKINPSQKNESFEINEKWKPLLRISPEKPNLRMGETINILISASIFDSQFSGDFELNFPIIFSMVYDQNTITSEITLDSDGQYSVDIQVPIMNSPILNITAIFLGSAKLQQAIIFTSFDILPQLLTKLTLLSPPTISELQGRFLNFKIQLFSLPNNETLEDQQVVFILKQNSIILDNFTRVTDEEGIVELSLTIEEAGSYTLEYSYLGHSIFIPLMDQIPIEIKIEDPFEYYILDNLIPILISLSLTSIIIVSSYKFVYIPRKRKRVKDLVDIRTKFNDLENLQHLFIISKENGLTLFSHSFSDKRIEENLISGFISAISSFGVELGGRVKQNATESDEVSKLKELSYNQFKIIIVEGSLMRIALLLLKSPSPSLQTNVKTFLTSFETTHTEFLSKWHGAIPDKEPIQRALEKYLFVHFIYNYKLILTRLPDYERKLKSNSNTIKILSVCRTYFGNLFTMKDVIEHMLTYEIGEVETFNILLKLMKDNLFIPLNTQNQELVLEYLPSIEDLTLEEQIVLKYIYDGHTDILKLSDLTHIPVIIEPIHQLQKKGLVTELNELTELGKKIAIVLNLVNK
ncbi:hypothetical protein NEF87_001973 [Candidatus Lokiarchaeum ossiferum]|uniref:Uncharacterized protein n=1 Tax=Candidatus Lokiarchaeum ossiferum TaxID=2951803 RepID=A0ABY6HQ94_9ARCH|nr:hypothetical protein NEF87_001973 [Candidatus Lokiarchaeum sp. B-35]